MHGSWPWISLLALAFAVGCSNGSSDGGGTGGTGGAGGGTGGTGATAGMGGMGGVGGPPRMCANPNDCDDQEPCTEDICDQEICRYEPLPDQALCVASSVLSLCLEGVCQPLQTLGTCGEDGASDGDLCEPFPQPNPPRLGRCEGDTCIVSSCESDVVCWDQMPCHVGVCDQGSGTCSTADRPNGTTCAPPLTGGMCLDGECVAGSGGQGGAGGASGRGGEGGQAGAGGQGGSGL